MGRPSVTSSASFGVDRPLRSSARHGARPTWCAYAWCAGSGGGPHLEAAQSWLRQRRPVRRFTAFALLPFAFVVNACGGQKSVGSSACSQASPVTNGYVRLTDFDVFGVSSRTTRVATDPLFPRYPSALLPQKFRLQARHPFRGSLQVMAFDCRSGQAVRFYVRDVQNQRPQPASRFRLSGVRRIRLTWPPPLTAPDPPGWLVAPLFFRPGIGVVTFSRGHKVIEQLSLRVCIPKPGPSGDC